MSSSLILTNCLFCGIAALLLLPHLRKPKILTYKNGIPILVAVILILLKLIIPYEFSFTYTIASKNILPTIKSVESFYLYKNLTIGTILLCTWILIAVFLLIYTIYKYLKLIQILSVVPVAENTEIYQILLELCIQKDIKKIPKIIQLDINTGPFIVGLQKPIIVLPFQLSNSEVRFILLHELEHLKHHHILIKSIIGIVTAIYWWNPLVWLLRKEVIRALEMQADTNVIQRLSNKASLTYLESLIKISKRFNKKQKSNLVLPFALKNNMLEYRISTALKYDCFQKDKKASVFHILPLALSMMLLLFTFFYTFESYNVSPDNVEGTFIIKPKTGYFQLREDGLYDLYINEEYVITIHGIPEDLSNLPVYK